jgi:DNA-directed RNA polymerase specialized sigma24 family protein
MPRPPKILSDFVLEPGMQTDPEDADFSHSLRLTRVLKESQDDVREWLFLPKEVIRIGRSEESEVCLAHPYVSRQHAVLRFEDEKWICACVGKNRTFADGQSVSEVTLEHNMVLQFSGNGPQLVVGLGSFEYAHLPEPTGSVTALLQRLKDEQNPADESAAKHVCNRYFQRLASLARSRTNWKNLGLSDEEDVACVVLTRLLIGLRDGRFPGLSNRESLWRLLVTMTLRENRDQLRNERREKRGGGRVQREADFDREDLFIAASREPTGDDLVILADEIRQGFLRLKDDELRELALAKIEGYTDQELATRLGISVRTVERRLQKIRQRWSDVPTDDDLSNRDTVTDDPD